MSKPFKFTGSKSAVGSIVSDPDKSSLNNQTSNSTNAISTGETGRNAATSKPTGGGLMNSRWAPNSSSAESTADQTVLKDSHSLPAPNASMPVEIPLAPKQAHAGRVEVAAGIFSHSAMLRAAASSLPSRVQARHLHADSTYQMKTSDAVCETQVEEMEGSGTARKFGGQLSNSRFADTPSPQCIPNRASTHFAESTSEKLSRSVGPACLMIQELDKSDSNKAPAVDRALSCKEDMYKKRFVRLRRDAHTKVVQYEVRHNPISNRISLKTYREEGGSKIIDIDDHISEITTAYIRVDALAKVSYCANTENMPIWVFVFNMPLEASSFLELLLPDLPNGRCLSEQQVYTPIHPRSMNTLEVLSNSDMYTAGDHTLIGEPEQDGSTSYSILDNDGTLPYITNNSSVPRISSGTYRDLAEAQDGHEDLVDIGEDNPEEIEHDLKRSALMDLALGIDVNQFFPIINERPSGDFLDHLVKLTNEVTRQSSAEEFYNSDEALDAAEVVTSRFFNNSGMFKLLSTDERSEFVRLVSSQLLDIALEFRNCALDASSPVVNTSVELLATQTKSRPQSLRYPVNALLDLRSTALAVPEFLVTLSTMTESMKAWLQGSTHAYNDATLVIQSVENSLACHIAPEIHKVAMEMSTTSSGLNEDVNPAHSRGEIKSESTHGTVSGVVDTNFSNMRRSRHSATNSDVERLGESLQRFRVTSGDHATPVDKTKTISEKTSNGNIDDTDLLSKLESNERSEINQSRSGGTPTGTVSSNENIVENLNSNIHKQDNNVLSTLPVAADRLHVTDSHGLHSRTVYPMILTPDQCLENGRKSLSNSIHAPKEQTSMNKQATQRVQPDRALQPLFQPVRSINHSFGSSLSPELRTVMITNLTTGRNELVTGVDVTSLNPGVAFQRGDMTSVPMSSASSGAHHLSNPFSPGQDENLPLGQPISNLNQHSFTQQLNLMPFVPMTQIGGALFDTTPMQPYQYTSNSVFGRFKLNRSLQKESN